VTTDELCYRILARARATAEGRLAVAAEETDQAEQYWMEVGMIEGIAAAVAYLAANGRLLPE
jgi:phage tail protein X